MPSISNPDALQEKRERGAKEGNNSLFDRSSNVSIALMRKQCKKENGIKDEEEKQEPSQQGAQ